ncbi:MAG: YebC/PmpR family DNA-binding transcriptional regulator [Candidatus Magasanikbacteria bacterium]|nr:YebC/PmpR family DNA-binding transcriptional regulator [Candidatus Magasanikbacteria bacterium]
MSGHSKWHKIQHKKGKADAARSNVFTKLTRAITVAAQEGGGDPEMNFSLRLAIEKAKSANVPKDNIERAVKKGTGELKSEDKLKKVVYEGFGPGGVAIVIESVTDNTNRTVAEVKHVLNKFDGSLGGPGSVLWQFEQKGVVRFVIDKKDKIENWEEAQLKFMDAGIEDIRESDDGVELITNKDNFQKMIEVVSELEIEPDDSGLQWVAKEEIEIDDEISKKMEALYDELEELDDVKEVYTNEK